MTNMNKYRLKDRALIRIKGRDASRFLQNLITNDLTSSDEFIYSALLTPQGKYLFDFFVLKESEMAFLVDILDVAKLKFVTRLKIYKLRSLVEIEEVNGQVAVGFLEKPKNAFFDPRCRELGWRQYLTSENLQNDLPMFKLKEYDKLRVQCCIPETNIELIQDKTFILEAGFDRLSGISFSKGCFIGQEVTARMRHKTKLQKGFVKVKIFGKLEGQGQDILSGDKIIGRLYTREGDYAIAYLNFRYDKSCLKVGNSTIKLIKRFS